MRSYAFRSIVLLASTSAMISTPLAAAEPEPEPEKVDLRPSSAWQLNMAETNCRIARFFGEDEKPTVFYLEQWIPSEHADWLVAGPALDTYRIKPDMNFSFGPVGDQSEFEVTKATLGDIGTAMSSSSTIVANDGPGSGREGSEESDKPRGLPTLDSAGAKWINKFTLSQEGRPDLNLFLGNMEAPLAAMNACMKNLVESWGFDAAEQATVQTPPVILNMPKVGRKIVQFYPEKALVKGAQANFALRLTVSETGEVEECALVNQTTADDFDMKKHPCEVFRQLAEFEPARDATGKPVRSYYFNRMIYRVH